MAEDLSARSTFFLLLTSKKPAICTHRGFPKTTNLPALQKNITTLRVGGLRVNEFKVINYCNDNTVCCFIEGWYRFNKRTKLRPRYLEFRSGILAKSLLNVVTTFPRK